MCFYCETEKWIVCTCECQTIEYQAGHESCPYCGHEIVIPEGLWGGLLVL